MGSDNMNQNVIQEFAYVHDNRITAYHVDIDNHVLKLETVYEDKEITEIIFTGWMAHQFEDVISLNIIFSIKQMSIDHYIDANLDFLKRTILYSFPASFGSVEELKQFMIAKQYNIYEISSAIGLSGTVFAKDIKVNVRERE